MTTATKSRPEPVLTPVARDDYIATARMSFDEWIDWDYEGGLTEWIDGEVRVYMPVKRRHLVVTEFLWYLLHSFAEFTGRGISAVGPYPFVTASGRGREPDLMFISDAGAGRAGEDFAEGPVDLVVEVISDDSVTRDRRDKFIEYEESGVREYWLIESRPGRRIARFYVLDAGRFAEARPDELGIYRSTVLDGFWLDVSWLWEEQPRALAAWTEIAATLPAAAG